MTDIIPPSWHTVTTARDEWVDAPVDEVGLATLLTVAKNDVISYAPKFTDPDTGVVSLGYIDPVSGIISAVTDNTVPADYRLAQLMQARNTWNANKVDPSNGQMGDDTFVMRPFPLDWFVKQLIRPNRGPLAWVG